MRKHRLVVPFLSLTLACASYACSGDDDGALPGENDSGADAAHDSGKDAHADAHVNVDAGADTSTPIEDTGTPDTTVADTSVPDTSVPDTSVTDTGTHDTGVDANDGATAIDAGVDASDASIDANDGAIAVDASADANDGAVTVDASDAGPANVPSVYVLRVGDGTGALSSASAPGFLERISVADGTVLGTIALPTTATGNNQPITFAGSSAAEGELSLSTDGHFISVAGYAATTAIASISGTSSSSADGGTFYRRVVARVDASGTVDTTTQLEGGLSAGSARGATSKDGTAFWVSGSGTAGGVHYVPFGVTSTGTQIMAAPASARWVGIFGSQLYVSAMSAGFYGVDSVGTGLPTTSPQTATPLIPALTGLSTYGFVALDLDLVPGIDTIYVADDRAIVSDGGVSGGVEKWTLVGTTWTVGATYNTGLTAGLRGITSFVTGKVVTLVATTGDNKVVTAVDDGVTPPLFVTLTTGAANTAFRGIAPVPN